MPRRLTHIFYGQIRDQSVAMLLYYLVVYNGLSGDSLPRLVFIYSVYVYVCGGVCVCVCISRLNFIPFLLFCNYSYVIKF